MYLSSQGKDRLVSLGTKIFVHNCEVSIAQGLVTDHVPLPIVAYCCGTRQTTMKLTKLTILKWVLLIYDIIWTRIRGTSEISGTAGY